MKKIIALALSLMMLLGCVSAFAETAEKDSITMLGAFSISYDKLPEGYTLTPIINNEMEYYALIASDDPAKAEIVLMINFSDEWDGVENLSEVSEDDLAAIKQSFYEEAELDDGDISFEDAATTQGTPLLIARAKDDEMAAVYAIYKSHEIEVIIVPGNDKTVVMDDNVASIIHFLSDVEFTPIAQ